MGDEPPSPTAGPHVEAGDHQQDEVVDLDALATLLRTTLAGEGVPATAEVTLLLVDEGQVAALNVEHLGGDGPTDVLSFPLDGPSLGLADVLGAAATESDAGAVRATHPEGVLVGDVVICPAVARRNADERGLALDDELRLLVVHGALHLLGHDHADEAGAAAMRQREQRYAGRSGARAAGTGGGGASS